MLIVLLLLFSLIACRPRSNNSSTTSSTSEVSMIRVELDNNPALGDSPLSVFLLEEGNGITGAEVEITGDMTHAGMVPVIVNATETEPGLYRAEDFQFTMAGDWIVTTEVKLPDGKKLREELKVTVPGQ